MKATSKNIVGLKELRENMETYIQRVQRGESLTILRRNVPLFTIRPIDDEESEWETVIDFTEIDPRGVPIGDVMKRLKKTHG